MLEVLEVFCPAVIGVLATFETVVMYGHFNESRDAWYRQIVEIKPKFPIFAKGVKNGVMSTKTLT